VSRPVGGILWTPLRRSGGHPSKRSTWGWSSRKSTGRAAHAPCSTLLRVGFTEPTGSPLSLVRSYRTVSPLPVRLPGETPSAVCFLWHFPAGHPDWPLTSTLSCGVPTFLDSFRQKVTPPTRRAATTQQIGSSARPAPACTAQSLQSESPADSSWLPASPFGSDGLTPRRPPAVPSDWSRHLAMAFRSEELPAPASLSCWTYLRSVRFTAPPLSPVRPGFGRSQHRRPVT